MSIGVDIEVEDEEIIEELERQIEEFEIPEELYKKAEEAITEVDEIIDIIDPYDFWFEVYTNNKPKLELGGEKGEEV